MDTRRFLVPLEGDEQTTTARQYLRRLWPEGTDQQIQELLTTGAMTADGIVVTRQDRPVAAQTTLEITLPPGEELFDLPDAEALLWGEASVVVDKPVGIPGELTGDDPMHPLRFLADVIGLDRETFAPAWVMPATAGGPWLLGRTDADARAVAQSLVEGALSSTWIALIPRPDRAHLTTEAGGLRLSIATTRAEGPLAEVQITPTFLEPIEPDRLFFALLKALARAGFPVLGDDRNGGYLVAGGVRLRLGALYGTDEFAHSWPAPSWWPDEPVLPAAEPDDEPSAPPTSRAIPDLQVSHKTLEILGDSQRPGHPWVLRDDETGSTDHLEPGQIVRLVGPHGPSDIHALIDGTGPVVARYFTDDPWEARNLRDAVLIRLDEAIAARADLFAGLRTTDAFRVVHGEADGLPGLWIDRLGPAMRIVELARCAQAFRDIVVEHLTDLDPAIPLLAMDHTRDLRDRDGLPTAAQIAGVTLLKPGDPITLRESGLKYRAEPWEGVDIGFFADQRDNRLKVRRLASPGERWLNLFCHTGAFSVALATEGAHTTNVDVSRRYLRWLDENFALNGLDLDLRRNAAGDARTFLESTDELFDGIVVDPPTAASGPDGFWSVREHYPRLLSLCFEHLKPGAPILVCRNERRPRTSLSQLIRGATSAKVKTEDAPPAADYPRLKSFPEGTTSHALFAWTEP